MDRRLRKCGNHRRPLEPLFRGATSVSPSRKLDLSCAPTSLHSNNQGSLPQLSLRTLFPLTRLVLARDASPIKAKLASRSSHRRPCTPILSPLEDEYNLLSFWSHSGRQSREGESPKPLLQHLYGLACARLPSPCPQTSAKWFLSELWGFPSLS